jgi:predicted nucleic-acid-binding protein
MIGLDTNIIIRYLTQDDKKQSKLATQLIEQTLSTEFPGFITLLTLVEISWVLESCYGSSKADVSKLLSDLLVSKQLLIERKDMAYIAIKRCKASNADFSDALITVISELEGCKKMFTFDKKAQTVGMEILTEKSL